MATTTKALFRGAATTTTTTVLYTVPSSTTTVVSNIAVTNTGSSAYKFWVADSGNCQNTNGSYGSFSDAKLKENIVDATPKLDDVMKLRVRNFNLKDDENKTKLLGFIAQEIEQVFPAAVDENIDYDEQGNDLGTVTKAVKTTLLVPILVKAIQELKAEFDEYKKTHP